MVNPLTEEQIKCLNSWPEGTIGYYGDEILLKQLNEMCKKYGYGYMGQVVKAMEEIWRNPEKEKEWQAFRDERMSLLEKDAKFMKRKQ